MKVYTDSTNFADLMVWGATWRLYEPAAATQEIRRLNAAVFGERPVQEAEVQTRQRWQYLLASASSHRSQYDLLIDLRRQGQAFPDGVLCLAGAGNGLHGLRQRPWAAEAGNIHLSVHFVPDRLVTDSGIPFMVLAAVSVVDAIDSVSGLTETAGIKWVNDILLDNAKVAGVLAYTEGAGKSVDAAVLGIGLNVETTPTVAGTPFVPRVGAIRDFLSAPGVCTQGAVFEALIAALDHNYQLLLDGRVSDLMNRYRERSVVVGKAVTVCVDDASSPPVIIATGRVEEIGDNLELFVAGHDTPVTRGRLILESEA
jgi:BirA family biotin operon repressor/biotin-[acetyl-CoA-carboxylase] ligase